MTPPAQRKGATPTGPAGAADEPNDPGAADVKASTVREVMGELRKPFPSNIIGKLPRITCGECRKSSRKRCDNHEWVNHCATCNGGHSSAAMHIDFVGHAAVTDRLLAVDPAWSWEPMGLDQFGLPALDGNGQLWIRLTIAGVTRIGVGDNQNDGTGSSGKVLIGDAIRNAAMRFGVALDLWTKQDLAELNPVTDPIFLRMCLDNINEATTREALTEIGNVVRTNRGLLALEDRDKVNQAWIERRDKMGEPA